MRAFHVSKRWKTFSTTVSSFCVACSTIALSGAEATSFVLSWPKSITIETTRASSSMTVPSSLPSCCPGTFPMNIIRKITVHSSTAVDRFSTMISGMMNAHTMSMYFIARLSVPAGVCMALRICAVASIRVPLAISDGWNCMPRISIHRCEPLVLSPTKNTTMSRMNDSSRANGVTILKYRHLMFIVHTITTTPTASSAQCFSTGPR